jgi:uncharacterized membrane protein
LAQQPSVDDTFLRGASEVVGGPVGPRARPHRWWTPVRVILAIACVTFCLGMLQKTPCVTQKWNGTDAQRYGAMCYSDVPYLYLYRGFAERNVPYSNTHGRWEALEYPVVIGYFAYGAALVTHAVEGWPDVEERKTHPAGDIFGLPGVAKEYVAYFDVTAVMLAGFALLAAWFMAGAHRGRPWDALLYVASPALVLAGLINWDILAVCALAAAMWAWVRGRPILSGVMIGLGTATKLYPVFLLGALFVVCLRRRQMPSFFLAAYGAAGAWLVVNLPPMAYGWPQWKAFWSFNQHRGADLGSIWLVLDQAGHPAGISTINRVSELFLLLVCVGVLVLGLLAPRTPRIPQLAFLIVCGFLLVNKVYSPQYVLWLLPLAALARPRWRDVLIWQAAEVFYFGAVWLYLGNFTQPASSSGHDHVYWAAIVVRMLAEIWFAALVVRDVLRPEYDPVREDGVTDDPMMPLPGRRAAPALS